MAWTNIVSTQTDTDSPVDQTLMDAIRENLDDLNTRVTAISASSSQEIRDDFATGLGMASNWDPDIWQHETSGGGAGWEWRSTSEGNHYLHIAYGGAANHSALCSSERRMHIQLDEDHHVIVEFRIKRITNAPGATQSFIFGLQDVSLLGGAAFITDTSDFIGFTKGTNADSVLAKTSKGGVGATIADNQGDISNWTILQVDCESTTGGTVFAISFYVDGVQVGSTHTAAANVPDTSVLVPAFGFDDSGAGVAIGLYCDYALAYWAGRPLMA